MTGGAERAGITFTYASGAVAGLWIVLALARPESTFHLAPLLVGLLLPLAHRWNSGRLSFAALAGSFVGGLLNVGVPIALLQLADKMRGPAFGPFGSPLSEAIVLGAGGAALGVALAALPWPERR